MLRIVDDQWRLRSDRESFQFSFQDASVQGRSSNKKSARVNMSQRYFIFSCISLCVVSMYLAQIFQICVYQQQLMVLNRDDCQTKNNSGGNGFHLSVEQSAYWKMLAPKKVWEHWAVAKSIYRVSSTLKTWAQRTTFYRTENCALLRGGVISSWVPQSIVPEPPSFFSWSEYSVFLCVSHTFFKQLPDYSLNLV